MPEKPPAADARNNIESVLHEDRKFDAERFPAGRTSKA
jgi:hypothetical protein